jgi:hypothetical protein
MGYKQGNYMNQKSKTFVSLVLLIVLLPTQVGAFFPPGLWPPADKPPIVPVPISDAAIREKEVGLTIFGVTVPGINLDSIAIAIVKEALEQIVDSTVDWINNGFNGNPSYVSNPGQYFANVADQVSGAFINSNDLNFLCSPFENLVRANLAVNLQGRRATQETYQCTYSGVKGNVEDFARSFSNGGWEGWFSMTQNDSNNVFGATLRAQIELDQQVAAAIGVEKNILDWGSGFFSYRDSDGNVKTPGTVIEGQLQKVLGTGVSQLELADEFDELLGALLSQLLQNTVFSSSGLGSGGNVSGGNSVGGGSSSSQSTLACYTNTSSTSIGSTVTWQAQSSLRGGTVTYTWSGSEINGLTGQSIDVTYTSPTTPGNEKAASVTATVTDQNGQVVQTQTASCRSTVAVSKYQPITASCRPDVTSAPLILAGSNAGSVSVPWRATVTGGSGNYLRIDWDSMEGQGEARQGPVLTISSATSTLSTVSYTYSQEGNRTADVTVVDADSTVAPLVDQMCSGSVYIYKP